MQTTVLVAAATTHIPYPIIFTKRPVGKTRLAPYFPPNNIFSGSILERVFKALLPSVPGRAPPVLLVGDGQLLPAGGAAHGLPGAAGAGAHLPGAPRHLHQHLALRLPPRRHALPELGLLAGRGLGRRPAPAPRLGQALAGQALTVLGPWFLAHFCKTFENMNNVPDLYKSCLQVCKICVAILNCITVVRHGIRGKCLKCLVLPQLYPALDVFFKYGLKLLTNGQNEKKNIYKKL